MRRLHRSVLQAGNQAPSLPNMFNVLTERQVAIRIGEVSLIAGQPGSGKSTLAMALAWRAQVPTLYMSADTHAHTMAMRMIAMMTDTTQDVVEAAMQMDREWASEILKQADHIRWSFDSAPTIESIEEELKAFLEVNSRIDLLVVDNLTDMVLEGDEFGGMRSGMKDLKFLAREYDVAILVLHHTTEGVSGNPCPPRFALMGKVAQTPALVLTVATMEDSGAFAVAAVKNRYGPANPGGTDPVYLEYDPARMYLNDYRELAYPS